MSNVLEMKTLEMGDQKFECVDDYARKQIKAIMSNEIVVTSADVFKCNMGHADSGESFPMESLTPDDNGYALVAKVEVKKGDVLRNNSGKTYVYCFYMLDTNNVCVYTARYSILINDMYTIPCDGTLVMECSITDETLPICVIKKNDGASDSQQNTFQLPEYKLIPVMENDVVKDTARNLGDAPVYVGSKQFADYCKIYSEPNMCTFDCKINEGDMIIFTHLSDMYNRLSYYPLVVVDDNGTIVEVVTKGQAWSNPMYVHEATDTERIAGVYKFKTSGTLYMVFRYTDVYFAEYFYIKRTHPNEPFVLYTNRASSYTIGDNSGMGLPDNYFGDEAMKAIMSGRQIVIRLNNRDGSIHSALYSPVYRYDVPNYRNGYLYLHYIDDAVNSIDLSAMGLGVINIPVQSQLKLKVSREYHQSPLV